MRTKKIPMSSLFSQMNFAIAAALAVMMLGRLWFGVLFARPYAAEFLRDHQAPASQLCNALMVP